MDEVKIYDGRANGPDVLGNAVGSPGETCRLCLKRCDSNTRFWGIFEADIPQKLMAFAAVQIQENDGLPTIVCINCRNMVYMSYNFKCQVEKSDHDLRQVLLIRETTAQWPTVPVVKSIDNINSLEGMVPCLQKNILNSCMAIQNDHTNNHEQFIFDIANSCNMGNVTCKQDHEIPSSGDEETRKMVENINAASFEISNIISQNGTSDEDATISFEAHYEMKNIFDSKSMFLKKDEPKYIQDNSNSNSNFNQSDDDKPLILRTKRHKCNYCIKSFANLTLLEKHAVIHKKQSQVIYVCYLCDAQFSSVDKVKDHAKIVHDMNINKESIMEDSKMKRITGWVKKIGDNNKEKIHLISKPVEENKISKFICKFCCRQFTNRNLYLSHLRCHPDYSDKLLNELNKGPAIVAKNSHLTDLEDSTDTEDLRNENSLHLSDAETFSSNLENSETASQRVTQKSSHQKTTNLNGIDESDDDASDDDDDEDDHNEDGMTTSNIQCNQCGKLVSTMRNLKRHLLTHSGAKHNCSICGKDFSRPDKLKEHQQLKHKNELQNKSDTDNDSPEEGNGKKTEKKKKKRVRPHKCSMCPKAFAQPQSLANHEERHRKGLDVQKRFLCEVCSKCFAQSGSLVAHMRTHTGVKPYVCNVCSRAFTKSTYLQLHLRTHSGEKPYICQYCNRAFARANTLARHITMHTGEAKYQCQICSKSFRRLTSLNEHTYTHTGQRPYACKICSKRYNNAGSLYAHTKKCKTMQASANVVENPPSLETNTNDSNVIPQVDNNALSQVLIFSEKKFDDAIVDDSIVGEPSICQFMITNVHNEKTLPTNMLEPFLIQESDIYNINAKQLKSPYYGLYPST